MPSKSGNCAERVHTQLTRAPEKSALWSSERGSVSFSEVCAKAAVCQKSLAGAGVQTGDAVLLICLPSIDVYPVLVALLAQGITVVFMEPWMPRVHLDRALRVSGLKFVLADTFGSFWRLKHPDLRQLTTLRIDELLSGTMPAENFRVVSVNPQHAATITFTSGTTGLPKGIARSHEYLWNLHEILERHSDDRTLDGPDLSVFPNLALYHLGTGRGSLLVPQNWDVRQFYRALAKHHGPHPQSLTCGPAFMERLLDDQVVFSSVKALNLGGALIECRLMERVLNAYPHAQVRQVYGGTEVEPVCVVDAKVSLEHSLKRGFSHCLYLGKPIPELKTKLDSDGVLWVSGANVCGQYIMGSEHDNLSKEIDEAQALWHSMGDRIVSDNDGFWFNGRKIQRKGDFELEQELYRALGHTRAYIHRGPGSRIMIVGDDNISSLKKAGERVFDSTVEVVSGALRRDRRHRSRIDRDGTWRFNLRAARIGRYLKERSPLPVLVVLALGPLVSGWMFASKAGLCSSSCMSPQNALNFFVGLSASLLFLIAARAMDEIKDSKKDQTANPDRPLPRGLVDLTELKVFLKLTVVTMLVCCSFFLVVGQTLSAMLFTASTLYLWLMYKEFYIASWLSRFPLLYAVSHQIVVLPLTLFGFTLVFNPLGQNIRSDHFDAVPVAFVMANLFASLTYEFSRKLQPDKHLDAQTYRHIYGHRTATLITIIFALLSMTSFVTFSTWAASKTESLPNLYLVPLHASLILILIWHALRDGKHKYAEGAAAFILIISSWYGLISFW